MESCFFTLGRSCILACQALRALHSAGTGTSHESRKDQTADDGDVGHGEGLTGYERLYSQNGIEVMHTPEGFVALTETPFFVLINLGRWARARVWRGGNRH